MKELLTTIKFAYQRAVRGYDDRVRLGYGLGGVLDDYLIPLWEFCAKNMYREYKNIEYGKREKVYHETMGLIDAYLASEINTLDHHDKSAKMWEYIGAHMGYYWD